MELTRRNLFQNEAYSTLVSTYRLGLMHLESSPDLWPGDLEISPRITHGSFVSRSVDRVQFLAMTPTRDHLLCQSETSFLYISIALE